VVSGDAIRHAAAAPPRIEAEHEPGPLQRAAVDVRPQAEAAVKAVQPRYAPLLVMDDRVPDERAVAEQPYVRTGSCLSRTSRREASCSSSREHPHLRIEPAKRRPQQVVLEVGAGEGHATRLSPKGRRAECGEQRGFLLLRLVQMAPLDVPEAADVLGYARDLHGELPVLAVQVLEQLGDGRLVLADQAPLGLALRARPEDIRTACRAGALISRERGTPPSSRARTRFPRLAGAADRFVEDRRSKVELQLVAAFEHAFDLSCKRSIGIEPAPLRTRPCRPSA